MKTHVETVKKLIEQYEFTRPPKEIDYLNIAKAKLEGYLLAVKSELEFLKKYPDDKICKKCFIGLGRYFDYIKKRITDCKEAIKLGEENEIGVVNRAFI